MSESGKPGGRVIAVVPTYRPDAMLLARLDVLAAQVDAVIVVDDGSPAGSALSLDSLQEAGFELVQSAQNAGIAAALNIGTAMAIERGADYVLTLDQDTVLPPGYVGACLRTFATAAGVAATSGVVVGIVGTHSVNGIPARVGGWHSEHVPGIELVREGIQSGMVISVACLRVAGLFDERLVIDCVDGEFCLRSSDRGFAMAVAPGTDIEHSLGEQVPLRPFGIQRHANGQPATYEYHSPLRRYYITRNTIDLALRYAFTRPRWVASTARREIFPALVTFVSGPNRRRQVLAAVVGFAHAIVRRRGLIPGGLRRRLSS
ncbi:MAG: hypothetical protein JWO10_440 [Microbacteriaceae bacterium]|nr:hypothetical protein [Microbacteriaceae bacterium]